MSKRLAYAPELIETDFVALLADDEFFLQSGVRDVIRHLDSNPETIGCVGRCLYFFVDQSRFLLSDAYRDWKPFPQAERGLKARLEADLPPNKTHMTMYGVFRREVWRKIMTNSCQKNFSCAYTYERLMNLQRTLLGSTDIIDSLLWMRSKENSPIVTTDWPRNKGQDFVSWARDQRFADEVTDFREIVRKMSIESGVCEAEVAVLEDRFFNGLVERQASKDAKNRRSLKNKTGQLLLSRSPKSFRLWAKRHLPGGSMKFLGWEGHSPEVMMESLRIRGTHFSREELRSIELLALDTVNN
jgi:hypothetical protein